MFLPFVRGLSLGILSSGALIAIGLLTGVVSGVNRFVFVGVAVAAFLFSFLSPGGRWATVAGSLVVTGLGLGSGAISGFGRLEIALVAGGLVGSVVALGLLPKGFPATTGFVAVTVLVLVLAALVPLVLDGGTLGHDESAYALKGRVWLQGTPDTGWSLHRGPALSVFGYLMLALDGAEPALRSIGLISLAALIAATWALGERLFGGVVGPVAALVVVAGPSMLRRATEYLTDIPSAALLTACMVIVWGEFAGRDEGPTMRLLWMLPLAWGAFYLRYQSILAFGLIALTIMILWLPRVRSRPWPLVATLGIGLVGLLPHFLYSIAETGSPLGIIQYTSRVAGRAYLGEGLVDYALAMAWPLMGLVGIPIAVFFSWWIVAYWRKADQRMRAIFLGIPALGQVILLGLLSHGEPRFVFFPLALLSVGGAAGFMALSRDWQPRVKRGAEFALASLLIGSIALSIAATRGSVDNRVLSNEPVELAAELVEAETASDSCGVMTSYAPQITFYSGCATSVFRPNLDPRCCG